MHKTYSLQATVWLYPGKAAWHFVTLPTDAAQDIDFYFSHVKKGWGSLPVTVTIGQTTWTTSIFPDKKAGSYLLPLKAAVREKENIEEGLMISFELEIAD